MSKVQRCTTYCLFYYYDTRGQILYLTPTTLFELPDKWTILKLNILYLVYFVEML